jgi:hypothetical protein
MSQGRGPADPGQYSTPVHTVGHLGARLLFMGRVVPLAHLHFALAVFILLGSMVSGGASAADQSKGAKCAALDDPAARLACFDAAFPRAPHSGPPNPAKVAVATDEPASEAQNFGLSASQINAVDPKPVQPPVAATTAAVKTVRRLPSGHLRIGLDNDQLWQQTEIDSRVWLQPGDRVTIRHAALGSYLLDTPAHFSTRVRRIQ